MDWPTAAQTVSILALGVGAFVAGAVARHHYKSTGPLLQHLVYVGPLDELKGKWALVKPHPTNPWLVLAQFDGYRDEWRNSGNPGLMLKHPLTGGLLGTGWHAFPQHNFGEPDGR